MFRIESYITPIILSYVDKYIKNIRPQDSQMSLWGGEVSFQNLDLRLDVLEEELQLPFSFLSGHIHELTIHVPWTKIASESISITINTIEFVLKLKDADYNSTSSSTAGASESSGRLKKASRADDPQQVPTGYMASLVNKIANNISINCHNIIFKYVEEDIVMSMNIQLLSINSADLNWQPAFVDVSLVKVILRKIISITDLTICLDKRNETGKIEICQEPILYRCSMKLKLLRRYNVGTAHKSSFFRADLHCESIKLNVSSVQFPMLMRLIILMYTLKEGKLRKRGSLAGGLVDPSDPSADGSDESLLTWAWNLLPSIFPTDEAPETDDQVNGHIVHMGCFIDHLEAVLKDQKVYQDTIVNSTKKFKYNSFLRLVLSGCTFQSIAIGNRWFNMRGGIQSIDLYPCASCVCGKHQSIDQFIRSKSAESTVRSLYPSDVIINDYKIDWDDYYAINTDEILKSDPGALKFDVCHLVDIPDDSNARSSDFGSDLEMSGLAERYLMRVFLDSIHVQFGPNISHIFDSIQNYISFYNYPHYVEERPVPAFSQLPPPSSEDYDALMNDVPLQKYQISFNNCEVELKTKDHVLSSNNLFDPDFQFLTRVGGLVVDAQRPMYFNRLVYTTCQLPQPPLKLFNLCSLKCNFMAKSISIQLNDWPLVSITTLSGNRDTIIYPHLWQDDSILNTSTEIHIPEFLLKNANLPILRYLFYLSTSKGGDSSTRPHSQLFSTSLPTLNITLKDLKLIAFETSSTKLSQLTMGSIYGTCGDGNVQQMIIGVKETSKSKTHVLEILHQSPVTEDISINPNVIKFNLDEIVLGLDPFLIEFFSFDLDQIIKSNVPVVTTKERPIVSEKTLSNKPESTSDRRTSKHSVKILESVHSSSEKNITVTPPKPDEKGSRKSMTVVDVFDLLNKSLVSIDLKGITVLSKTCNRSDNNIHYVSLGLPSLNVQTSIGKIGDLKRKLPYSNESLGIVEKGKEFFPWSINLSNMSADVIVKGKQHTIVESFNTNITFAITQKVDQAQNETPFEVVLHVDTTPVKVNIKEYNLDFLLLTLHRYSQIPLMKNSFKSSVNSSKKYSLEIANRPISPDSNLNLKEFFDIKTTQSAKVDKDNSSDNTEIHEDNSATKLSIWMQWTFTKLALNLENEANTSKFALVVEDIICSLDQRLTYSKFKVKIGTLSGQLFKKEPEEDKWTKNENLGFCGKNNEIPEKGAGDTFLDLTVTKAETGVVHTKWGVLNKKNRYLNDNLTEIMVKMQQVDFKIDIDDLMQFLDILNVIQFFKGPSNTDNSILSVADFPLIYFQSRGFRVFIPLKTANKECSLFILKIGDISVTPTVENPLSRAPLRADIYTKATQLRILNLPGSKIEDRQYELSLKNITLGTGNWTKVLSFMENLDHGSIVYNENPAFVWNNQATKASVDISAIFKDFNCSLVFAPAIVFNNILVCGQSIEYNCLSDLTLNVNINQIVGGLALMENLKKLINRKPDFRVLKDVYRKFGDKKVISRILSGRSSQAQMRPIAVKVDKDTKNADSGIGSSKASEKKSLNSVADVETQINVPHETSFVGGMFTMNVYQTTGSPETDNCTRVPLVSLICWQPNFLYTQGLFDKCVQMSVFNMQVSLAGSNPDLNGSKNEFTSNLFVTYQGKLNALGIPPSIFKIKYLENVAKEKSLSVNLCRPMSIYLTPSNVQKLISYQAFINKTLENSSDFIQSESTSKPKHLIHSTKKSLINCSKVSFSISRFDIYLRDDKENDLTLNLTHFGTNLMITERPEKLHLNVTWKSLTVLSNDFTVLHPTPLTMNWTLSKEFWQKNPVINVSAQLSFMQLDLGPSTIQPVLSIAKTFQDLLPEPRLNQEKLDLAPEIHSEVVQLIPKYDQPAVNLEELYQDDLRAGAFQYVEVGTDSKLPLPYQIQIINKEVGVICWRYPQPRAMHKVEVYPVPFPIVGTSRVQCYLEYYSESCLEFLPYSMFLLSESKLTTLSLPKKVTASIWRVVMSSPTVAVDGDYFEEESSSIEEDLLSKSSAAPLIYNIDDILRKDDNEDVTRTENEISLHPKILIACMKIDSYFSPALIPNFNAHLDVGYMEVNLVQYAQEEVVTLPKILAKYTLNSTGPVSHHFGQIKIDNVKINSTVYDDWRMTFQNEFRLEVFLIDYSYLLFQPVLENCKLSSYIEVAEDGKKRVNVLCSSPIRVRITPSMVHTVEVIRTVFSKITSQRTETSEFIIMTRFLICNSTNRPLYFGQTGTEELITLQSMVFDQYSFRNCQKEQSIVFSIECSPDRAASDPCFVSKEGEQCLKIGQSCLIIIIEKLSSTLRKITIRGQLEIFNLSREKFQLEIVQADQKLESSISRNVSVVSENPIQEHNFIRIRFESGGWSGDIPIRGSGKKMPWLVKVPIGKTKYLSYWIKVIRKPIGELLRFVIVILPLYFVRSYLSKDSLVEEVNSGKKCTIFGRGMLNELYLSGTHDDDHLLRFLEPFKTLSGHDQVEILLSYKSVDKEKIFPVSNDADVDFVALIKSLDQFSYEKQDWPVGHETGIKRRALDLEQTRPIYDFGSLIKSGIFNSLVLEVAPWCHFINSLCYPIRIISGKQSMEILSNETAMPFEFKDNFILEIAIKSDQILKSNPITLTTSSQSSKKSLNLIDDSFLNLDLADSNSKVLMKLTLFSSKENNMKIITVSSQFVAVNLTDYDLDIFAFNVPVSNDKNLFFDKSLFQSMDDGRYKIPKSEKKGLGTGIAVFNNEFSIRKKPNKKGSNLYIIVEHESAFSCPIVINESVTRRCISLPLEDRLYIPLAVSVIKLKVCHYISIVPDLYSDLEIRNSTDCSFYVAQSDSGNPVRECEQFHWYDVVTSKQVISYNPPAINKHFPDLVSGDFSLIFALCQLDNTTLKWSEPVKVNESCDIFLNIPYKGDLKVTVDTEYSTKRITIDYISQHLEFSARDIRSRLLNPVENKEKTHIEIGSQVQATRLVSIPSQPKSLMSLIDYNICVNEISLIFAKDDEDRLHEKIEVMSMTVDNFLGRFDHNEQRLSLTMGNIQVDNQLHISGDFDFPVVFCRDKIDPDCVANESPILFYLDEYIKSNSKGLVEVEAQFFKKERSFKGIHCKLRPIRVYSEDKFASNVMEILLDCTPENATFSDDPVNGDIELSAGQILVPKDVLDTSDLLKHPVTANFMKIEAIQILLSVHTSGRVYIALDHSPLAFSAFERKNVKTSTVKLGSAMGMHYLSGAIFGAGWMFGSLEILGSPSGLARSVSTGLKDFVSKPVEGLFKGPWDFVVGITAGSTSLVRNITAGTVNSVTKLATSVARNLDRLTLDQEHVQRTDAIRRYRPNGVTEGIAQGLTDFGITLLGAIGGIARHTLEARTPGQVLSGVGKGIMGVILKPISGAAELVALTGQGVLHSVGYNTLPSSRSLAMRNTLLCPSTTKLVWKVQQLFYNNNPIVFATTVTLIKDEMLSPMFLGFSQSLIILLDLTTDEVIDILQLAKVHPELDNSDSTIVHLRILSKIVITEQNEEIVNFHQIASRVREYIQSSMEQLTVPNNPDLDSSSMDLNDPPIEEGLMVEKTISFYVHSTFSHHIVEYINMIKMQ